MLVKDWMSKTVITIDVKDSMQDAINSLKEYDIPMLPVMKDGKLCGIVTDRDLKRASPSDTTTLEVHELLFLISKIKVRNVMTKDPITVPSDFTVEEAAELFLRKGISGAPVVDQENRIVGTITKNDLFRVLVSLTGIGRRGLQFAFQIEDNPGTIKELADIMEDLEEHVFHYHVKEDSNDFANWIKDIFKDIELAEKIAGVKNKKHMQLVIYKHIAHKLW